MEQLCGMPKLQLPTDFPRKAGHGCSQGGWLDIDVPEDIVRGVESFAARSGATMYMVLLSSLQLLLAACSGQDNIVVSHSCPTSHYMPLQHGSGQVQDFVCNLFAAFFLPHAPCRICISLSHRGSYPGSLRCFTATAFAGGIAICWEGSSSDPGNGGLLHQHLAHAHQLPGSPNSRGAGAGRPQDRPVSVPERRRMPGDCHARAGPLSR